MFYINKIILTITLVLFIGFICTGCNSENNSKKNQQNTISTSQDNTSKKGTLEEKYNVSIDSNGKIHGKADNINRYLEEKAKKLLINPYDEKPVMLREVVGNVESYMGKTFLIGPVEITNNGLKYKFIEIQGIRRIDLESTGGLDGIFADDLEARMSVYYGKNYKSNVKLQELNSSDEPICYVKVTVVNLDGRAELYLDELYVTGFGETYSSKYALFDQ